MTELAEKMAASKGLKWSAFIQQLLIRELKASNPSLTTEALMGTVKRESKPKLKPAQRVALVKLEMAKKKPRKK